MICCSSLVFNCENLFLKNGGLNPSKTSMTSLVFLFSAKDKPCSCFFMCEKRRVRGCQIMEIREMGQ